MSSRSSLVLLLGLVGSGSVVRAEESTDLLAEGVAWSTWSARPEIAPRFSRLDRGGPGGQAVLAIAGGGRAEECGCWLRPLPTLRKGRRYRIEASFQADDVAHPGKSIWALVTQGNKEFAELAFRGTRDGWSRMALDLSPEQDYQGLELRLNLAWTASGNLRWSEVSLRDVTDQPASRQVVRAAAISGRLTDVASPAVNLDFYCAKVDEVGRRGVDLICLPEVINVDGIEGDRTPFAEPIPGPFTERLAEQARQYKTYIAASLLERDGELIYNTGILLDRSGTLVGKYRKTHPTIGEALLKGITPGDDYPVFETDFGRLGYMICFDNHYPEVARILSLKGAQILVHSNMSDGREGGTLWEPYMRTRAVDNNVHIVSAVNYGRSLVVNPRGEILEIADKSPGSIAMADCDLSISVRNYSKRDIGERYRQVRRADSFGELLKNYGEFLGDEAGPSPGTAGRD